MNTIIAKSGIKSAQTSVTYYSVHSILDEGLDEHTYIQQEQHFDNSGNIILETQNNAQGSETVRIEQKYLNGVVAERTITENKEVTEHSTFEYSSGKLVADYYHYLDGSFDKTTYEYKDEVLVKKIAVDDDDEFCGREEYKIENKLPVEIIKYDEAEKINRTILQQFNDNGDLLERTIKDEDGEVESHILNTYDEKKRMISQEDFTHYRSDNPVKKILQYDREGKHILTLVLDEDNETETKLEITYNKEGLVEKEIESTLKEGSWIVLIQREIKYD